MDRNEWIAHLQERGEAVSQWAKQVPPILGDPELTLDQATNIFTALEKNARSMKEVVAFLEEEQPDDDVLNLARRIDSLVFELTAMAGARVLQLQK